MKGLTLNAGFVAWAEKRADEDALLLQILWQAGCVFYVRTTEPQTLVRLLMKLDQHRSNSILISAADFYCAQRNWQRR